MVAHFELTLHKKNAWTYPRLFWETGVLGQVLYLEAHVIGISATGIGCFFDDPGMFSFTLTQTDNNYACHRFLYEGLIFLFPLCGVFMKSGYCATFQNFKFCNIRSQK